MINESFEVTFGVEFEAILAFTESLLREHLPEEHKDKLIRKSMPESSRTAMRQTAARYRVDRPQYTGWGLTFSAPYGDQSEKEQREQERFEKEIKDHDCRGYADEPMTIAKGLFSRTVRMYGRAHPDVADYSTWYLAQENSLVGVTKQVLLDHLKDIGQDHFKDMGQEDALLELENWDSHPIELVSPPLRFNDESFQEIRTYLHELTDTSDDQHTALITDHCGMHVHVGLPDNRQFDLPTLQHLAYIIVQYQPWIRDIFPKSRGPGSVAAEHDLLPNLENFWSEDSPSPPAPSDNSDKSSGQSGNDQGSTTSASLSDAPACPTIPFDKVRDKIFYKIFPPKQETADLNKQEIADLAILNLAKLMQGDAKNHIINWNNIKMSADNPENLPILRTIEFRQHEGTLNPDATEWWVTFVVGLVRLAADMAQKHGNGWEEEDGEPEWVGYDGTGYLHTEWNENLNVRDLFEMINMKKEARDYFEGRLQLYGRK